MANIVKSYNGVTVLKNVNFKIQKGEIHALLGENGAGKTTLMNILGGVTPMDSGSISLFGENVSIANPADSQANGIAFIHQELNVVNDLTVYENMFLNYEIKGRFGRLNVKEMCRQSEETFRRMRVDIDPRAMMRNLETSYKQIVEIAKSLLRDAKLIIMDEPTTSLSLQEIDTVFSIMRNLTKEHGVTIIFISHKLGEVTDICDSFTVLRNGEKVVDGYINPQNGETVSQADLARYMVGRDVLGVEVYSEHEIGDVLLEVENLCVDDRVKNISFTLRRGEILGVTGLLGDGKVELARAIFGDMRKSGTIRIDGQELNINHPVQGKMSGIGYLPDNRKENAIIKDLSVQDNITIVTLDRCVSGFTLDHRRERKIAEEFKDKLRIQVTDLNNKIVSLSGGNQQKAVISKWLAASPKVMILSNPTQGVDVGAKNEIYSLIMDLIKQGVGVIITTGEVQEAMKLCDRVLVMYHGELRGELSRGDMSEESIMILSTGGALS
jgi:ribose transport system ATP-binding protein